MQLIVPGGSRIFRTRAVIIGLLSIFIATACQRSRTKTADVIIETEISPQSVRVGPAALKLKIRDLEGKPIRNARITIEGNMTHPGMNPVFAEAKEVEPGSYQAPLEFTMAGDWIILLHVTLSSGQTVEKQVDVPGVRPN